MTTERAQTPVTASKKSIFLTWRDLRKAETKEITQLTTAQDRREFLTRTLDLHTRFPKLPDGSNAKRREVFLDLCLQVLSFTRETRLSPEKISTFFSLVNVTHITCCERGAPPPSLATSFAFFEEQLLRHSVERPPFSVAIFSFSEVKAITDWMINRYFRHLRMYQYVFSTRNELEIRPEYSLADFPDDSSLLPLEEATAYRATQNVVTAPPTAREPVVEETKNEDDATLVSSDPEVQAKFEAALSAAMANLTTELNAKMEQQQTDFVARVDELESKKGGKKK